MRASFLNEGVESCLVIVYWLAIISIQWNKSNKHFSSLTSSLCSHVCVFAVEIKIEIESRLHSVDIYDNDVEHM